MKRVVLALLAASCLLTTLDAQSRSSSLSRIALFEPSGQKDDTTLAAVLATVANSVELSLDVLQHYDVKRLPAADPVTDLDQVRAYCQKNRMDQAILGSGSAREGGGYSFRLVVYDRQKDTITTDAQRASTGVLDMFDTTDALVAALLDGLSGTHLAYGSLSVQTDPAGAAVSVNGRDVGAAPLSLRGIPVGTLELSARLDGYEAAKATVTISDGETTSSSLTLPKSLGVLSITVPKDAQVTVGSAAGEQKKISGSGISMLPAGDYEVEADCPGLPQVKARVTITTGAIAQWVPWAKGYLDVRSDPDGAAIVVDGQDRGVAPLVLEVDPGIKHHVELKKQDYETYGVEVNGDAGSKTLLAGSLTPVKSTPAPAVAPVVVLAPATTPQNALFKIDGSFEGWQNISTWRGIPTLVDLSGASPVFMGDPRLAMAKIYICRDDKYLYWRVDFAGMNPILAFPQGAKRAIDCELTVHFEHTKQMHLGAQMLQHGPKSFQLPQVVDAYVAIHDDATHSWSTLNSSEDIRNSERAIITRIGIDQILRYCKGPVLVEFMLGDDNGDGTWESTQVSETRTVDFSK
jgi:hypothetical protein